LLLVVLLLFTRNFLHCPPPQGVSKPPLHAKQFFFWLGETNFWWFSSFFVYPLSVGFGPLSLFFSPQTSLFFLFVGNQHPQKKLGAFWGGGFFFTPGGDKKLFGKSPPPHPKPTPKPTFCLTAPPKHTKFFNLFVFLFFFFFTPPPRGLPPPPFLGFFWLGGFLCGGFFVPSLPPGGGVGSRGGGLVTCRPPPRPPGIWLGVWGPQLSFFFCSRGGLKKFRVQRWAFFGWCFVFFFFLFHFFKNGGPFFGSPLFFLFLFPGLGLGFFPPPLFAFQNYICFFTPGFFFYFCFFDPLFWLVKIWFLHVHNEFCVVFFLVFFL